MTSSRHNFPATHAAVGADHRLLGDEDVLRAGDETACISTLLAGSEDWIPVLPTWTDDLSKTIRAVCDDTGDIDGGERIFRRKN